VSVVKKFDHFPRIGAGLEERADAAVTKTAQDLAAAAQAGISRFGLIDTGAMFNSVQAHRKGPMRWLVEVGQSYAVYHVFGTRHLPARDFWHPAIGRVRAPFLAAMRQVVKA